MGKKMRVRLDREYWEPGNVGIGVRQGCTYSISTFSFPLLVANS